MTHVTAAQARKDFSSLLSKAAYAKERFVVTKHNTEMAAVISMEELRLLDALRERYSEEPEVQELERELSESQTRVHTVEFLESACVEMTLTPDSYASVVDLVSARPKATKSLRELVARYGD